MGELTRSPQHYWEPRAAVLKPYLLDATVAPFGIRIELTPTDLCAYVRITFPQVRYYLSACIQLTTPPPSSHHYHYHHVLLTCDMILHSLQ